MSTRSDEIMERAIKIVTAIRNKHGVDNDYVPKEFIEGSLLCPICKKGTMAYSISNHNGHRSAHCECFGQYCE